MRGSCRARILRMDRKVQPDKTRRTFEAGSVRPLEDVLNFGQSEFVWYLSRLSGKECRSLHDALLTKMQELDRDDAVLGKNEKAWKKSIRTKIRYAEALFRERDFEEEEIPGGPEILEVLRRYPEVVAEKDLGVVSPDGEVRSLEELTLDVRSLRDVRSHIRDLWRRIESSEYVPGSRKGRAKGDDEVQFERDCKELEEEKKKRSELLLALKPIRERLDRIQKTLGKRINDLYVRSRKDATALTEVPALETARNEIIGMLNAVSFDKIDRKDANPVGTEPGIDEPADSSVTVEPGHAGADATGGVADAAADPITVQGSREPEPAAPASSEALVSAAFYDRPIPIGHDYDSKSERLTSEADSGGSIPEKGIEAKKRKIAELEEELRMIESELDRKRHAFKGGMRSVADAFGSLAHTDDVRKKLDEEVGALEARMKSLEEDLSRLKWELYDLTGEVPEEAFSDEKADSLRPEVKGNGDPDALTFSAEVCKRFERFGIDASELHAIPGLSELTEGQQVFVAEMLRQSAARKIEDRAHDTVALGAMRNFRLTRARRDVAETVLSGGIEEYRADIEQLSRWVTMSGLDVSRNAETGRFDIRFLSPVEALKDDETAKSEWDAFNGAAFQFANIPQEWGLPGATKRDRKRYEEAKAVYDAAVERLEGYIDREREHPAEYGTLRDEHVALRIADNRVRLMRYLQAHPEVEDYLDEATDTSRWSPVKSFFRTVAAERAAYFVGGAGARAAGMAAATAMGVAGTLGLAVAPLVSMVSGGVMAYRRAEESLAEQDRRARRGMDPVVKDVPSDTGWFRKLMTVPSRKSEERLVAGKRRMVRASASLEEMSGDRGKRGLAERLDDISEQVRVAEPDSVQSERALAALQSRVEYVKERLKTDAVKFGDGAEGVRARVALMEALARAEMSLGLFSDAEHRHAIDNRFGTRLKREETETQDKRKSYRWKEMQNGMVVSGTIAMLGMGTVEGAKRILGAVRFFSEIQPEFPSSGPSHGAMSAREHLDRIYGEEAGSGQSMGGNAVSDAARQVSGGSGQGAEMAAKGTVETKGASRSAGAVRSAVERVASGSGRGSEAAAKVVAETRGAVPGVVRSAGNVVEEARRGDGVTHLARRAFAEYAARTPELKGLSAEQKVYVEDYLSKKVGHSGALNVGDKIEFSDEMMKEAAAKANGLSATQVEGLRTYADRVSEFQPEGATATPGSGSGAASAEAVAGNGSSNVAPEARSPVVEKSVSGAEADRQGMKDGGFAGKDAGVSAAADGAKTAATETVAADPKLVSMRSSVISKDAKKYLVDSVSLERFRKAASASARELFPATGGGVNNDMFLKFAKQSSKGVYRDCLLAVAQPERLDASSGMNEEGMRRLGKFLIAARRSEVSPETIGSTETFRAYFERISVEMAKKGLDPATQISSVSDKELDSFAKAALEASKTAGNAVAKN